MKKRIKMSNKISKPKIVGIMNVKCGEERADFFTIKISEDLKTALISLLTKLGFRYDKIKNFDSILENEELFIFVYQKNIRVYLLNGPNKNEVLLIINSKIDKQKLINLLEKYFQIF